MKAENFSLQNYLTRIGCIDKPESTLQFVTSMMKCQLQTVPFENLDVQVGKIVSLVPEEIVEKIVEKKRGGYCYEVNGIFSMALASLGIPYQYVAARPMFYPARRPKTHMAIIATIDNKKYLIDLGFGSYGIQEPLCLDTLDSKVQQGFDYYQLSLDNQGNYLLQALVNNELTKQYEFDLSNQEWVDFVPANYLNSTHPDAIFVQKLLVIVHTPLGRRSLVDSVFKEYSKGALIEERLIAKDKIDSTLKQFFGLLVETY